MKMLGGLRQEITFARRQSEIGRPPGWLGVPLIATSHTWENAKNEQSHQDPTLPEALLGEMSDTARVYFPIDSNSAVAALRAVYRAHGQIACLVTPKRVVPHFLSGAQAERALADGAVAIAGDGRKAEVQIVAIGAYQTQEALRAFQRLRERGLAARVTVILEPGRFRIPRDDIEHNYVVGNEALEALFPSKSPRVILAHTRPEPMLGILRRLDGGPARTRALGYINRGGTLDVFGMLFANRCTWGHAVDAACLLLGADRAAFLSDEEIAAIDDHGDPNTLNKPETRRQAKECA
jgi:phosphoketolase